jgi:hypothetical protein
MDSTISGEMFAAIILGELQGKEFVEVRGSDMDRAHLRHFGGFDVRLLSGCDTMMRIYLKYPKKNEYLCRVQECIESAKEEGKKKVRIYSSQEEAFYLKDDPEYEIYPETCLNISWK